MENKSIALLESGQTAYNGIVMLRRLRDFVILEIFQEEK
jgi:hypothetical protein